MKKFKFMLPIAMLSFLSTNAQITKGNWLVGGTGSYRIQSGESINEGNSSISKASGFSINANVGYFPTDNLAIGLSPMFGFSNPEGSNNSSTSYGLGPFIRYYYLKPEKRINIFSHLEYFYGLGYRGGTKQSDSNGYMIKNGASLFFNSSVALEFSLNYNGSKNSYTSGGETKFKDFNIGVGFQIHLEK